MSQGHWEEVTRGRRSVPPPAAVATTTPEIAAPAEQAAETMRAIAASGDRVRLSWYMHGPERELMTRMRDEVYFAAGAENPGLEKQDAASALARVLWREWGKVKHRVIAEALGREEEP